MKNKFLLVALSWLISFSAFSQFPVNVNQIKGVAGSIPDFVLKNESTKMISSAVSNSGTLSAPSTSGVGNNDFYSRPVATIVPNQAVNFDFITPKAGRMQVIYNLSYFVTGDCFVNLHIHRFTVASSNIAGAVGQILLDGMIEEITENQPIATGGTINFNFSDHPLILMPGDRIVASYWRNSTSGVNFLRKAPGALELSSDNNYNAKLAMLVIGDSLTGITSDDGALTSGTWPEIIKTRYKQKGKDIRLINIGQGGINTNLVDWWVKQGRIDNIKADIMFINLGMNDTDNGNGLSSGSGFTKTGIKNIAIKFNTINPGKPIVINSISPTDIAIKQTWLPLYRAEIAAAVTELQALGIPAYFSDTSTAYSTATGAAYLSTEQTAGTRLHDNTTVGQPARAEIIWNVCKDLLNNL